MDRVHSEMLDSAQKYIGIVHERGKKGLELERVYRNLRQPGMFLLAYNELYSKHGATTEGTDPEDTIQKMSLELVDQIRLELAQGTYRWKPSRRVYVEKPNGGLRPISIPCWRDKLLQGALRLILNAYYEPQFSNCSHGFRPNRGCHTALGDIVKCWWGTVWFIEGDIKGCFDNIDHEKLLAVIGRQIKDERLIRLLKEMLEAGYMEDWTYKKNYSGTPQGGVVSPILANIFLNELDTFIEDELIPKYTRGDAKKRTPNPTYTEAYKVRCRAATRGDLEEVRRQRQIMQSVPTYVADDGFRRLRYVRYADDFLLGFVGPKEEVTQIKEAVKEFLSSLGLTLNEKKTLITHAKTERAKFLGYEVGVAVANSHRTNGRRSINGVPMLKVPHQVVRKWRTKFMNEGTTAGRTELLNESDYDIVRTYAAEFNGIANYYEMAVNRAVLHDVKGHFTESLVKTLAEKHRESVPNIYRKYQREQENGPKYFEVRIERQDKNPLVAKFGENSLNYHRIAAHLNDQEQTRYFHRNQQSDRLLAEECELCGSKGPLQGHHVRKLSDVVKKYRGRKNPPPPWVLKMSEIHRKTLFLCPKCHHDVHMGRWDGEKVG